ncbi:MAG: hypothetical protein ABUL56_04350 [Actinomycetota bacterium]
MIPSVWLKLIKQRAEGYPIFRARDLEPEATHARRLIASWRRRGDVVSVAHGYHLVAADGSAVMASIDLTAYLLATTRFGRALPVLCTVSAARVHGVLDLDPCVGTVTVPMPTRPIALAQARGTLIFCTRAEQIVGTRNVTLEEGDLDVSGARAIVTTTSTIGGSMVQLTSREQTALDLIHDRRLIEHDYQLDSCLLSLAPSCEQERLDGIAFDQRRRRARISYRSTVSYLLAWR